MMLAADLTTYYNRVRRHLDCPKDEQNRLLLGVNKQVIELQADAPNLDYDGIVEFLGEPESLANSLMDDIDPEVILSYQKRKHRLHEEGKVVSEDNRVRIYFAITASGVDYLEKLIEEYRSFTGAVDQILDQENSNTIRIRECS